VGNYNSDFLKKKLKTIAYIFLAILLTLLLLYIIKPRKLTRYVRDVLGLTCIDYKQPVLSKQLTDKIPDYIEYSIATGIKKCKDEDAIEEQADRGKLVEVKTGKGFIVQELSHSYPYLTRDAKNLLDEISRNFQKKISGTRLAGSEFKITSMTRSTEKLKRLRGVNSNASLNSPHLYGNAFDLSYIKFKTHKFFMTNCDEKYLMEALAEVIWKLRKERKCWATFEKQQNCFHVVAR
jgi:hypothetical protein